MTHELLRIAAEFSSILVTVYSEYTDSSDTHSVSEYSDFLNLSYCILITVQFLFSFNSYKLY
jgi:hypothetical protein